MEDILAVYKRPRDGDCPQVKTTACRYTDANPIKPGQPERRDYEYERNGTNTVRPGTDEKKRRAILEEWYREQIKKAVRPPIVRWEPVMGVKLERFFVQRMKTKWGSCNAGRQSIRLNTDLAKKPPECLEYIVVREMAHLLVRHHNDRFSNLMDTCLPHWKLLRQTLNATPLAHVNWDY